MKLYAESDGRQKLVGILNFGVDWQRTPFEGLCMHAVPFKKCVDQSAVVVISTSILDPASQSTEKKPLMIASRV